MRRANLSCLKYGKYGYGPGPSRDALRTGDLARRDADGLFETRRSTNCFVKRYGLRIDLQRVETTQRGAGVTALTDGDGEPLVAVAERPDGCDVASLAADASGLPRAAIHAIDVDEVPLLPMGKPEYRGVQALAERGRDPPEARDLRGLFADVLRLDFAAIDPCASFVDLGGNSLSYVAMSVRLERAIGHLPSDLQRLPLADLESATVPGTCATRSPGSPCRRCRVGWSPAHHR